MGAVVASIGLENAVDRGMSAQGLRDESATQHTVIVACADERKKERPVAGPVTVRIGDRFMSTDAIVGPSLSEPLIGQVILGVWI